MDKDIPHCFYFIVYSKLRDSYNNCIADRKEVKTLLRAWNIPKSFRDVILKEMEMLGLIKLLGKYKLKVNKVSDSAIDHRKFFYILGDPI